MKMLHKPLAFGAYTARGNLFLAPVAGYSDAAYRSVCADLGCDMSFTEMVSSEALTRDSAKTRVLLERAENEGDYAVQLFGSDPATMARAAELVYREYSPAIIDVNCGCPVPKIIKSGAGSVLMRDPARIGAIVSAMRQAVPVPITVKIRLGWDDGSKNFLEVGRIAEQAGAAAVTLHARTRAQGYSGKADRRAFGLLAEALSVPVIASGDLFHPEDAVAALDGSQGAPVAGVMLARGAMGDPFLFARTRAALRGEPEPQVDAALKLATARKHFLLSLRFYDERTACVEFRKHACAYLKGMQGGAELRAQVVHCSNPAEYEAFFAAWEERLSPRRGS